MDWSKCLFADESCFSFSKKGTKLVKRHVRKDRKYLNQTSHCSRKLVSVFGVIGRNGLGPLLRLDSRLKGQKKAEILDGTVAQYVRKNFGDSTVNWIEDNCPAHS